ncbi:MAG: phosphoribosyltransferase [Clostridia bacterium]|nr:phosphoribosyltransferase [Clostridia bacterium]
MPINMVKLPTKRPGVYLRVAKGHFATSHSHMNYFIDITMQKTCLQEATAVARELVPFYRTRAIVDTIICLDGTEVIGTCLAHEMTKMDLHSMNAHQEIYVVTPEHTSGSQLLFRENVAPMIEGKNVLILAASVVTGYTAAAAIEAIKYYNGYVAGVASIFATVDSCEGYPVTSLFNPKDLPDYASYNSHKCPMCQNGQRIDALVNCYGYSKL